MLRFIILILFILSSHSSILTGQIKFETGYFIDNNNNKIHCKIKNYDWERNPSKILYKINDNDDKNELDINDVKEFGIGSKLKYLRSKVMMDRTSDNANKLIYREDFSFQEETIFLKILIEGEASLFQYNDVNFKRFFFSVNNSNILQLISYKYVNKESVLKVNNKFRTQIANSLECLDNIDLEKLEYERKELIQLFINHNKCKESKYTQYKEEQNKRIHNLSIKVGANYGNLIIEKKSMPNAVEFNSKFGYQIGIANEFVLPFYGNKWAIAIEPTFQFFKSEMESIGIPGLREVTSVDYKSIEVPIGIRHYFFLTEKIRLYLNGFFEIDFRISSNINYFKTPSTQKRKLPGTNFSSGFGFDYKDKYKFEFRHSTRRNIVNDLIIWEANHNELSVIFGFKFF